MPYQFECPLGDCEFLLRSADSDEIERLVRAHARLGHRGRIDPADIDRGIEQIELA